MHERFTEPAIKVMTLANQAAMRLNHEYIGTEHLLLGLVEEGSAVTCQVLRNLGIDLRKVRSEVEKLAQPGSGDGKRKLPQTPKVRKVIENAIQEARSLKHASVGPEHLLVGLLLEQEGVAAQILLNLGLTREAVRRQIAALVSGFEHWLANEPTNVQDLPAPIRQEVAQVEAQIDRLNQEKEAAVAEEDFEKAAYLRDQADKLKKKRQAIIRSGQLD
jgi:ATP-dependent Clp protease ATP-binding subunit ClpC